MRRYQRGIQLFLPDSACVDCHRKGLAPLHLVVQHVGVESMISVGYEAK